MMTMGRLGACSVCAAGVTACEMLDFEDEKEDESDSVVLEDVEVSPEGAPVVEWHVGEGTDGEEHVHEGLQTADGGYIAVGQTEERSGSQTTDMLVVKVDADGGLEWSKRIGTTGEMDVGIAVLELDDGYLAAGGLWADGSQQSALVRLDADGEVVWTQRYHNGGASAVRGIAHMSDGRVAATGYTEGYEDGFVFISEESTGFLMVVDDSGEVSMSTELAVPQGTKVRQTADGGFAVLSTVWADVDGADIQNAALVKVDAAGTVEWQQTYGGSDFNQAFDFDLASDGAFVIAGHTVGYGAVNWDCLMLKVDAAGTLEWAQRFGQPRGYDANYIHDECYGVRVDTDGNYVMAGGTGDEYEYSASGHAAGPSDEWKGLVVKVSSDGEPMWMQVYGDGAGEGNNATEFLGLTRDGGYLLFNDTDSAGPAEPNNFGFMKLSPPSE